MTKDDLVSKDTALKMAIEALENIAFEYGQLLDGDQDYGLLPSETNEDIVIAYRVKRACEKALAEQPTGKPTRLEVIDAAGRAYTNWKVKDMQFSYQDDGKTLKIFIKESE